MQNPNTLSVGYAYVPPQRNPQVSSPEEALFCGTLYPELYMPIGVYDAANCKKEKGGCVK